MRLQLALLSGKITRHLSRLLRLGEGSTLPGRVAEMIYPAILSELINNRQTVVVTGTNGKTTTTHLINQIMQRAGLDPVHNTHGANLRTGIITALLARASITGNPGNNSNLLEVDEATLQSVLGQLNPRVITLTNIFRDQLDRFGDLDGLLSSMAEALKGLSADVTLVVNGDDPLLSSLASGFEGRIIYYGLKKAPLSGAEIIKTADVRDCYRCGHPYLYHQHYYAHLGNYYCSQCGNSRPRLSLAAEQIGIKEQGVSFVLDQQGEQYSFDLKLPGLYSVYNALAALATAQALGFDLELSRQAVHEFQPVFGRMESFTLQDRRVVVALVKNPTGFNEVLKTLAHDERKKSLLLVLNDNIADGEDVSWIWDVVFTVLPEGINLYASGLRAEAMALRLKYSGRGCRLYPSLEEGLQQALQIMEPGEVLYILPTYTALLQLRQILSAMQKKSDKKRGLGS